MSNQVKVWVNSDGCISCGACVAICPNIFQFGDDGKSHAIKQPETDEEIKCSKEAAEACPVSVINVEVLGEKSESKGVVENNMQNDNSDDEILPKAA